MRTNFIKHQKAGEHYLISLLPTFITAKRVDKTINKMRQRVIVTTHSFSIAWLLWEYQICFDKEEPNHEPINFMDVALLMV